MRNHKSSPEKPIGLLSRKSQVRVLPGAPATNDYGRHNTGNSEDSSTFAANQNAANVGECDERARPLTPFSGRSARFGTTRNRRPLPRKTCGGGDD